MSDDFENLVKRWLRDRAGQDRSALEALAGNVAVLPPRRRQPNRLLPLVASVVVGAGLVALVSPRFGMVGTEASPEPTVSAEASRGPTLPGGPEAFASDPRLATCTLGPVAEMEYAFEMTHGRDYQSYFPAMLLSPELDVDDPVLVVVYREGWAGLPTVGGLGAEPRTPTPGTRIVCVVIAGERAVYSDVDITGLTIDVAPSSPQPSGSAPVEPNPVGPSTTPDPAPAWMAGAEAALGCDGRPADFKPDWSRGELHTTGRGTPELALAELAHRANSFGVAFPTVGLEEIGRSETPIAFGYSHGGAYRAVAIVGAEGVGANVRWWVDDVAVCPAEELGPDAEIGVRTERWTDAAGSPVDAAVIETPDCYFGTKLLVDGRLFVWSPAEHPEDAYPTGVLEAPIGVIAKAPDDALDTTYRSAGRSLYLAPDGTAAFVILLDGVQRWAHVTGDDFQRTDCN